MAITAANRTKAQHSFLSMKVHLAQTGFAAARGGFSKSAFLRLSDRPVRPRPASGPDSGPVAASCGTPRRGRRSPRCNIAPPGPGCRRGLVAPAGGGVRFHELGNMIGGHIGGQSEMVLKVGRGGRNPESGVLHGFHDDGLGGPVIWNGLADMVRSPSTLAK